MSETNKKTEPEEQRQKPKPYPWVRIINYIESKIQERRTERKQENPQDKAARLTASAEYSPATTDKSLASLFPSMDMRMDVESKTPVSAQNIEAVKTEKAFVYIFGEIKYLDIFQNPHVTHVAAFLDVTLDPPTYIACEAYNDAD